MHLHNDEIHSMDSIEKFRKYLLDTIEWSMLHGKCCSRPQVEVVVEWGHVEGGLIEGVGFKG